MDANCCDTECPQELEPEFSMEIPHANAYKDIHLGNCTGLPHVTYDSIVKFLLTFDKTFDAKCINFYKER